MIKIIGLNLLLFIGYVLLFAMARVDTGHGDKGFNIAIGMGLCITIQVILNVVAGIVSLVIGKRELTRSFLISAAVLAPLGFVTWLVLLSIFG